MNDRALPHLVKGQGKPDISFKGRLLYTDTSLSEKRAEEAVSASQTLYLVISPLLFYGVEKLLSKVGTDSHIIAIESCRELFEFSQPWYEPFRDKKVSYFLADHQFSVGNIIRDFGPGRFRRIVPLRLNRGHMIDRRFYESVIKSADSYISTFWKNRMTTIHMGRLWLKNIFLNIPALTAADDISSLATDKPVFVAGAGESLESCIDLLKKMKNKLFTVAVDTAVPTLLDSGIEPDLVIAVESQHANLYDFYNNKALYLPVAFDLTSSPEIIRKHRGRKYFFLSEFEYSSIFKSLERNALLPTVIPALGSVGITAAFISLNLTGRNVFYAGLDFSFSPEKYHSAGSPSHIILMKNENRLSRAGFFYSAFSGNRLIRYDKIGRPVYTDLVMLSYADSLAELGSVTSRLFDVGKTGLKTDNPHLSVSSFYEKVPESSSASPWMLSGRPAISEKCAPDTANFFSTEYGKLSAAIRSVVSFINENLRTNPEAELPPPLYEKIKDLDYTYLFFPDVFEPSSDLSFLRRFLYSAEWFKGVIKKSESIIGSENR